MTDLLQGSELVAADGRRVRLGRRLAQGGEGTVFELEGEEGLVAKVFREPLSAERADKIGVMATLRSAAIDAVTAWPIELLALPSGEPIGLSLPKVAGAHELHQLYSPKSRRLAFPAADWRFLVKVAANLSRALAAVHAGSGVVADVNPGGVLVDRDGRVRLIDCEIPSAGLGIVSEGCHHDRTVSIEKERLPHMDSKCPTQRCGERVAFVGDRIRGAITAA